jgi:hypothetical protein
VGVSVQRGQILLPVRSPGKQGSVGGLPSLVRRGATGRADELDAENGTEQPAGCRKR